MAQPSYFVDSLERLILADPLSAEGIAETRPPMRLEKTVVRADAVEPSRYPAADGALSRKYRGDTSALGRSGEFKLAIPGVPGLAKERPVAGLTFWQFAQGLW